MRPREFLNQVHAWMLFEEQNVSNCYVFRDVSVKFLKNMIPLAAEWSVPLPSSGLWLQLWVRCPPCDL